MIVRIVVFCVAALWSNFALAQCQAADASFWPSVIRFEPALVRAGQPVTMVVGPRASAAIDRQELSISPGLITLIGHFDDGLTVGVPFEPREEFVPLGPLAAGQYTVRLLQDSVFCPTVTTLLIVRGTTAESVPTMSGITPWLTIVMLAALAICYRKRLTPRPHPSTRLH